MKDIFSEAPDFSQFDALSTNRWTEMACQSLGDEAVLSWKYDPDVALGSYYNAEKSPFQSEVPYLPTHMSYYEDAWSYDLASYSYTSFFACGKGSLGHFLDDKEVGDGVVLDLGLVGAQGKGGNILKIPLEAWREKSLKIKVLRAVVGSHSGAQFLRNVTFSCGSLSYLWTPKPEYFLTCPARSGCRDLCIDLTMLHHRGASPSRELGYALAHLVQLLRSADDEKELFSLLGRIFFVLPIGTSYFHELAKLRALRMLMGRVLADYGFSDTLPILSVPSMRAISFVEPHTNLLRSTTMCLSAILGGTDAWISLPFDVKAFDGSHASSARVSHLVLPLLREEGRIDLRVQDPVPGTYFLRHLVVRLAEEGWKHFQRVEQQGGLEKAGKAYVQETVQQALSKTKRVGLDLFVEPDETRHFPSGQHPSGAYVLTSCDMRDKEHAFTTRYRNP